MNYCGTQWHKSYGIISNMTVYPIFIFISEQTCFHQEKLTVAWFCIFFVQFSTLTFQRGNIVNLHIPPDAEVNSGYIFHHRELTRFEQNQEIVDLGIKSCAYGEFRWIILVPQWVFRQIWWLFEINVSCLWFHARWSY